MNTDPRIKALADANPKLKQQLMDHDSFRHAFAQLKDQYEASGNPEDLAAGIRRMSENPVFHPFHHFLVFLGDFYIKGGDLEAGAACLRAVGKQFPFLHHDYEYYLRIAQYHIEKVRQKRAWILKVGMKSTMLPQKKSFCPAWLRSSGKTGSIFAEGHFRQKEVAK